LNQNIRFSRYGMLIDLFLYRKNTTANLKHQNFREMVGKKIKAGFGRNHKIQTGPHQKNSVFKEFNMGIEGMYWEIGI
jgi:hypothetical protein